MRDTDIQVKREGETEVATPVVMEEVEATEVREAMVKWIPA